jgi:hypothetical protein
MVSGATGKMRGSRGRLGWRCTTSQASPRQGHPLVARFDAPRVLALPHQDGTAQLVEVLPGYARELATTQPRHCSHPYRVGHHRLPRVEVDQQPGQLVLCRSARPPLAAADQLTVVQDRPRQADDVRQSDAQVGGRVSDRGAQGRQLHVDGVPASPLLQPHSRPAGKRLRVQIANALHAEVLLKVLQHVVGVGR